MMTLLEWFPNYLTTDSLFTKMATLGAPWGSEIGQDMDDAYFTFYSGQKSASKFVELHTFNGEVNSLTIARILWGIYGQNWERLWNAFKTQYTPIDNYNIKEVINRTMNNDRDINKTINTEDSSDSTDTTEYGEQIDTTGDSISYVNGFNSSDAVPSGKVEETGQEKHSGTDTVTGHQTSTGKSTDVTTDNQDEKEDITRTSQGNVGQNSYQELLKEEFELWGWNFFVHVFEDVDSVLALSIHDPCIRS